VVQVAVAGQEGRLVPPGGCGDHAIDEPWWREAGLPAAAVDARGAVEVRDGIDGAQAEAQQEAAQVRLLRVAARACQDL
jgi:hypothetical protein